MMAAVREVTEREREVTQQEARRKLLAEVLRVKQAGR